ncbi:MAG TPA: class I SAM-dependent methyltransferase [Rhizomicrobium sp.]
MTGSNIAASRGIEAGVVARQGRNVTKTAPSAATQTRVLAEDQALYFDAEYHSPRDLALKQLILRGRFGDSPIAILDLGGGNGRFLDALLEAFPTAQGTLLDLSQALLARNVRQPRKRLVHGSIDDLRSLVGSQKFDVVTINWVLHHLVGDSYAQSQRNVVLCLETCASLLTPNGVIVVAENLFEGFGGTNAPSRIIYAITSNRWRLFARVARRFFNTAGVGVCFENEDTWGRLFDRAGLRIHRHSRGAAWKVRWKHRLLIGLLGLRSIRYGHFFLTR